MKTINLGMDIRGRLGIELKKDGSVFFIEGGKAPEDLKLVSGRKNRPSIILRKDAEFKKGAIVGCGSEIESGGVVHGRIGKNKVVSFKGGKMLVKDKNTTPKGPNKNNRPRLVKSHRPKKTAKQVDFSKAHNMNAG